MKEYWVKVRCVCTYKIKVEAELMENAPSNAQELLDDEDGSFGGDLIPMKPDFCKDYYADAEVVSRDCDDLEIAEEDDE